MDQRHINLQQGKTDQNKLNPDEIAARIIIFSIKRIEIWDHADLHPGNIL